MSNAKQIINEIDNYLDKFLLKNNKHTNEDLIKFIEEKWAQADDEKFEIYAGYIICGRMINEYTAIKDAENVKKWLSIHEKYIKHLGLEQKEDTLEKEDTLDEKDYFSGEVSLPIWEKFFGEEEEIYYDIGGDTPKYRLSKNHKRGLQYIIDNQQTILTSILEKLYKQYPKLQEIYDYDEADKDDFMPDVTKLEDFADLLSPIAIHILSVNKDGMPYIGYEFSCSWDREHGLGVMMFKDRVVEMEGADCSFLSWIAKKDLKGNK